MNNQMFIVQEKNLCDNYEIEISPMLHSTVMFKQARASAEDEI